MTHFHRCPVCGARWSHGSNDPTVDHRCPLCGAEQYQQETAAGELPIS